MMDHTTLGSLGIGLSLYGLYVEINKNKDPHYVAACDLSDRWSCSRVLTSQYSRGFGIVARLVGKEHFLNVPNCVLGILFYAMQLVLGSLPNMTWASWILYYSSVLSAISSLYLAYILLFVLQDMCIVCVATYFINFALLYVNYNGS